MKKNLEAFGGQRTLMTRIVMWSEEERVGSNSG